MWSTADIAAWTMKPAIKWVDANFFEPDTAFLVCEHIHRPYRSWQRGERLRVFVVLGYIQREFEAIETALEAHYANAVYKARDGVWFIRANESTTKEVSDRIGITPDAVIGNGLVVGMNGYFGRWRPDLWEWLNTKPEMNNE